MQKEFLDLIEKNRDKIEEIDQSTMHSGVFQALCQLRQKLNEIEKSLNDRDFEKASNLGYKEVANEFVFLQRALGGLQGCIHDRQKLIQDIAMETNSACVLRNRKSSWNRRLRKSAAVFSPLRFSLKIGGARRCIYRVCCEIVSHLTKQQFTRTCQNL